MADASFTYEAKGQVLVIHLPRELDHHNCRNLLNETETKNHWNCSLKR